MKKNLELLSHVNQEIALVAKMKEASNKVLRKGKFFLGRNGGGGHKESTIDGTDNYSYTELMEMPPQVEGSRLCEWQRGDGKIIQVESATFNDGCASEKKCMSEKSDERNQSEDLQDKDISYLERYKLWRIDNNMGIANSELVLENHPSTAASRHFSAVSVHESRIEEKTEFLRRRGKHRASHRNPSDNMIYECTNNSNSVDLQMPDASRYDDDDNDDETHGFLNPCYEKMLAVDHQPNCVQPQSSNLSPIGKRAHIVWNRTEDVDVIVEQPQVEYMDDSDEQEHEIGYDTRQRDMEDHVDENPPTITFTFCSLEYNILAILLLTIWALIILFYLRAGEEKNLMIEGSDKSAWMIQASNGSFWTIKASNESA